MTRAGVRDLLKNVTVAPITSTIRGLHSEVAVGALNGLDHACVISCDNVTTVPRESIGRLIGYVLPSQEPQLATAIAHAFDLEAMGFVS